MHESLIFLIFSVFLSFVGCVKKKKEGSELFMESYWKGRKEERERERGRRQNVPQPLSPPTITANRNKINTKMADCLMALSNGPNNTHQANRNQHISFSINESLSGHHTERACRKPIQQQTTTTITTTINFTIRSHFSYVDDPNFIPKHTNT